MHKHLEKTNINLFYLNNMLIEIFKGTVLISKSKKLNYSSKKWWFCSAACAVKMSHRLDIFHAVTCTGCAVWGRIASGMCNLFIKQLNWRTNLDLWCQSVLCWSRRELQPYIFAFLCFVTANTIYMCLIHIFMLFLWIFVCNTQKQRDLYISLRFVCRVSVSC